MEQSTSFGITGLFYKEIRIRSENNTIINFLRRMVMNAIYNNSTNTNILNNTQNTVTSVNNNQISKENSNSTSTSTKTDSIEISQKDTNKINAKKATDALDEVASGFPEGSHIKLEFFVMG